MTEQQRYAVIRKFPGFELRRYEPCVIAEVQVRGQFESAGSAGFRPLVSYIGGRNASGQSIAMTAPVLQEGALTTDVHAVSFVMPAGSTIDTMPAPSESNITMRALDEEWVAAAKFSGRWTEAHVATELEALRERIVAADLTAMGPPRFARYDPPWTPWFMRRNEVLIPVAAPTDGSLA